MHETDAAGEAKTTWHQIIAFNELAKEVAETVKKGEECKVIGYKHERQDQDKTIAEIYAATVKPPTKRPGGGVEETSPQRERKGSDLEGRKEAASRTPHRRPDAG